MSARKRTRVDNAIDDVRTAVFLIRCLLRVRAGHAPWHSRSRARIRALAPSRLIRDH